MKPAAPVTSQVRSAAAMAGIGEAAALPHEEQRRRIGERHDRGARGEQCERWQLEAAQRHARDRGGERCGTEDAAERGPVLEPRDRCAREARDARERERALGEDHRDAPQCGASEAPGQGADVAQRHRDH